MDRFFDVFQLIAVACFAVMLVGRTVTMRLRRGINPIVLGQGKHGLERVFEWAVAVGLPVYVYEVIAYAWPLDVHVVPRALGVVLVDAAWLKLLGALLVLGGFGLFGWALASFGDSWRVGIDERNPGGLVTTGAFAVSRNPIFVFMDGYAVGQLLLSGRLLFLLLALLVLAGTHYQILQEEAFLERTHGEPYRTYKRGTPRYFLLR